ncbi:GNAT family N-acetyltransferase [Flavobacterium sp. J27]|uniref:GNAT family N-acetyltransferase n=1 Tax=Flavobacterium sp. J27 TaxID=2060419 RepID=UPI001031AE3B|nr:GNAT family N-acetyltransferase [Flavobacterium sp. J27]
MNITIRKITKQDVKTLQEIGKLTFTETFALENSEENMKNYLDESFGIEKIKTELNDNNTAFYFAELDNKVIGYLKLNFGPSQTEIKDNNALEIERIYVLKEFHGRKAGQILFEKAIEIAKTKRLEYIWLGVWEKNHRALQFYTKNGLVAFDKHIFILGNDKQTDILMKLKIS